MPYKVLNHDLQATSPEVLERILGAMAEKRWRLVDIIQVSDGIIWSIHTTESSEDQKREFGAFD